MLYSNAPESLAPPSGKGQYVSPLNDSISKRFENMYTGPTLAVSRLASTADYLTVALCGCEVMSAYGVPCE